MKPGTKTPSAARRKPVAPSHRPYDIAGVVAFALALIVAVSLATEKSGIVGQALTTVFTFVFGRGAWGAPPFLVLLGVCFIRQRGIALSHLTWGLSLLFLTLLGALARNYQGDYFDASLVPISGGYLGAMVGAGFAALIGASKPIGLGALGCVGLILCVDVPIRAMLESAGQTAKAVKTKTIDIPRAARLASRQTDEDRIKPLKKGSAVVELSPVDLDGIDQTTIVPPATKEGLVTEMIAETKRLKPKPIIREAQTAPVAAAVAPAPAPKPETPPLDLDGPEPKEGYQLPPNHLLAEAVLQPKGNPAEMQANIETLESTLEEFGIDASVVEVANGPTVTRYELQVGPGVRVNKVTGLEGNIAMNLKASQVRIEAPIPGKAAIGIEVPNANPSMVTLRELCDEPVFKNNTSRLFFALGKDVSGVPKYADLTRMPHLLIGGATNSGKSIGLATLITSLLMRNTPKDLRLVMIDPKRVELTLFDHIPHLMCPVIKDVKEAAGVLRAVWREMDRRYDLFSEHGVRNIDGWNSKASFHDRMPYIVVVIDELADLMIQCGAEVETVIVRLAQLARAVGIHMVIATQRPSVDVITGLIKANIPSRIAFSVASQIDSRTILDQKGAESLIGRGDMLFRPIDAMKPGRVQGCYVSEKEIEAVCKFWREQQTPEYTLQPIEVAEPADEKKEGGDFGNASDPLWEDAVRWAVERGEASTSMLQRKFSIGFQRASRLMDMMHERGIIGPANGSRPRDVMVDHMDLESIFGKAPVYDVGRTIQDEEREEAERLRQLSFAADLDEEEEEPEF